ncbi:hypothetical protein ACQKGL_29240 [Ensifer adhaerens]|uniref:hypothetical protein n=1 Tax=Ensifer adhaerens TaxID=106592 RepID=UPI003D00CCFF
MADRDQQKLAELTAMKLEQREKLRAARVEIAKIDTQLVKAGASLADLGTICW